MKYLIGILMILILFGFLSYLYISESEKVLNEKMKKDIESLSKLKGRVF